MPLSLRLQKPLRSHPCLLFVPGNAWAQITSEHTGDPSVLIVQASLAPGGEMTSFPEDTVVCAA